jgi:biotin carboxylase
MSDFIFIIGGGLLQLPVIEEAKKMGYKTIVSDANINAPAMQKADLPYQLDIYDVPGHIKAALSMKDSIKAVVAAGIDAPVTQAKLAEVLGLPGVDSDIAALLHNKADMRHMMSIFQMATPMYWHVKAGEQCPIQKLPFDVVVKPCLASGSRGLSIIQKDAYPLDLYRSVEVAKQSSRNGECIVEERFTGTEHTVETMFSKGKFVPVFITDRLFRYDKGRAIETGLRHPSTLPLYVQRLAYNQAEYLGTTLGIQNGALKLDIMATDNGVRILEATTRLSGGFDSQYLVPAATGKNVLRAYIQVCLGADITPDALRVTKDKVAISESIWPEPGIIQSIEGVEKARKIKGVEQIVFRKDVGDIVEGYENCADRVAFIITSGDSYGIAKGIMSEAIETIKVVTA